MNTNQIIKILNRNSVTRPYFIGCFASNEIPINMYRYPHCMVVNLDPAWMAGSHWIALYCSSPMAIEYYDPLGIWPPSEPHITEYLSRFELLEYNNTHLQSIFSKNCGKHAIYFLYHKCLGHSMNKIIARLYQSKPDHIVNTFFKKLIFQ